MNKIADTCFSSSGLYPFPELWPFETNMDEILSAEYLKNIEARALKPDE